MQLAIFILNSIFAAFLYVLCNEYKAEATPCDTKWIRLVYMLSCGKKKRESTVARNESFSDPLPMDIFGALNYFRERDPTNPVFTDGGELLKQILEEDDKQFVIGKTKYGKLHDSKFPSRYSKKNVDKKLIKKSVLVKKIINSSGRRNHLGINIYIPEARVIPESVFHFTELRTLLHLNRYIENDLDFITDSWFSEIQGFPSQWDIDGVLGQKINENHRREIDRLLEECCKTAHESRCNGDTFRGACK